MRAGSRDFTAMTNLWIWRGPEGGVTATGTMPYRTLPLADNGAANEA